MPCNWKPPHQDWLKINVDGAVSRSQGNAGVGLVVRDWSGAVRLAKACPVQKAISPLASELLAIREAVLWCPAADISHGEISTDSKFETDLVSNSMTFAGPECFLVEEIRSLLRHSPNLFCIFELRDANAVAHALAQHALSLSVSAFWFYMQLPLGLLS